MSRNRNNMEIAFQLGAQIDPSVRQNFNQMGGNIRALQGRISSVGKASLAMAKTMATAFAGAAISVGGLVAKASESANEINKFSQVTGMSTESFQRWDYVMKNFGYSAEQASGDLAALGEKAMDAANGVGEGAELFALLGVKVKDTNGKLKTQEQLFDETIRALQGVEDITKRNAIASALLSTTGEELVPVLNMTNEELEKMKKNANIISNEDLKKAEEFKNKWNQVKNTFGSVITQIGIRLMPTVQKLLDYSLNNMPKIQEVLGNTMNKAVGFMESTFEKARPIIEWLGSTGIPFAVGAISRIITKAKDFYNFINDNWGTIKPILTGITIAIVSIAGAILALTVVNKIKSAITFFSAFRAATNASRLSMLGLNSAMWANPTMWMIAGVIALIAVGVLLYKNWDKVKEVLTNAFNAIKAAIAPVGESISNAFSTAYNAVVTMFTGIGDWFKGIFDGVTTTIKGAINSVIGFANSAIGKLNTIKVNIPDWVPGFGGKTFGLNIPNIPMLARGGITTGPTLAMIGEGKEQEAILPLSKLQNLLNSDAVNNNTVTNSNSNTREQIIYSPTFIVKESSTKDEIKQIAKDGYEEFKMWYERLMRDKKRTAF